LKVIKNNNGLVSLVNGFRFKFDWFVVTKIKVGKAIKILKNEENILTFGKKNSCKFKNVDLTGLIEEIVMEVF
jgi:hypothetical protein